MRRASRRGLPVPALLAVSVLAASAAPLARGPEARASSGLAPQGNSSSPALPTAAGLLVSASSSSPSGVAALNAAEAELLERAARAAERQGNARGQLGAELVAEARRKAGAAFASQASLLGDADDLLAKGRPAEARNRLAGLSPAKAAAELKSARYLLEARAFAMEGDPAGVVAVLDAAAAALPREEFEQERAFLAFTSLVKAGLPQTASEHWQRNRHLFEREFLPDDVEAAEVELARWIAQADPARARAMLRRVGRNFPGVSAARAAYRAHEEIACTPETLDEFFGGEADATEFARTILRRLGPVEDVRTLAFSLADIPDSDALSFKDPDALPMERKTALLSRAEFLLSVRESKLSYEITRRLAKARAFGPGFERDKLLFLYARGLNAVDKPQEAAKAYGQVSALTPSSPLARTARLRYVLSLHYAQRFKDVAKETRRLAGKGSRSEDTLWRVAWAEYLARDPKGFQDGLASARRVVDKERLEYWRARELERGGKPEEAKDLFQWLSENANGSHYGLLARWRLASLAPEGGGGVRLAARAAGPLGSGAGIGDGLDPKSEVRVDAGNEQASDASLAKLRLMVDAGLQEFARARVADDLRRERDPKRVRELARVAFHAQDYRSASLFPRRTFAALRDIPAVEDDLRRGLQENRELWQLSFPLAYRDQVLEASRLLDMDPFLVLGIMRAESNYDPTAVSWVGARGLMQIMPYTGHRIARLVGAERFDAAELSTPRVNVAFGAWYLKRLLTYYGDNLVLAVAAYNAGPEAVDRWLVQTSKWDLDEFVENIPYDQTRAYVGKVLLNMDMYHRLYGPGGQGLSLKESARLPKPRAGMEMF